MNKQITPQHNRPQTNSLDQDKTDYTKSSTPLLKKLPLNLRHKTLSGNEINTGNIESFNIKIRLESIHYSGKNYGDGWTFIISTLNHHWISNRIQIQRGTKSLVNKDIYNNITHTTYNNLQHLSVLICVTHRSGFSLETTLCLQPKSFKKTIAPKSIYTNVETMADEYQFHEIQTVTDKNTKLMFVFNFEITPNLMH